MHVDLLDRTHILWRLGKAMMFPLGYVISIEPDEIPLLWVSLNVVISFDEV